MEHPVLFPLGLVPGDEQDRTLLQIPAYQS